MFIRRLQQLSELAFLPFISPAFASFHLVRLACPASFHLVRLAYLAGSATTVPVLLQYYRIWSDFLYLKLYINFLLQ